MSPFLTKGLVTKSKQQLLVVIQLCSDLDQEDTFLQYTFSTEFHQLNQLYRHWLSGNIFCYYLKVKKRKHRLDHCRFYDLAKGGGGLTSDFCSNDWSAIGDFCFDFYPQACSITLKVAANQSANCYITEAESSFVRFVKNIFLGKFRY
ncbi:hypothetical protein T02_1707 [Trichinella nativa]|uniref:Uncharacterized protein n=1 Tax=Trichinella nativa TaxID=6335 RepID=A0A0V1LIB8_9BILA|nr:hypothetical protein T02_1707 [Trichinella nativa]